MSCLGGGLRSSECLSVSFIHSFVRLNWHISNSHSSVVWVDQEDRFVSRVITSTAVLVTNCRPSRIVDHADSRRRLHSTLSDHMTWQLVTLKLTYKYEHKCYTCISNTKQETPLSLTNRATHLCKRNGVADHLKHAPPHVLPCRIWSLCVKGCRHKYRRTPKLVSAGTLLSWDGRRG